METKKQVNTTHSVYDKNQPKRDLFRAVIGGTDTVRAGDKKYLPQYPGEEPNEYTVRKNAATIDGVVADGHAGLVGKVFAGEPDVSKVNPSIVPLLENIDNEGNHFNIFARKAFASAFDGHCVIVVDTPKAVEPVKSLEDERTQGIRPYWREYQAKDVTNWRWSVDPQTKETKLAMLVLRECTEEPDGPFGLKEVERYRVYRHDQTVTQELWQKQDRDVEGNEYFQIMPPMAMEKLSAIPAAIIGDLECEPWLLNEARLEIKAYQKESSFDTIEYLSIPTAIFKGRDDAAKKAPMPYGPQCYIDVSEAGDAYYMQIDAAGHASLKATIDGIKQEIAGKLDAVSEEVMPQGDQTATEVISDDSKSQARLVVWAGQLKDALELALQFTAEFMGMPGDKGGEIVLNTAWAMAKQAAADAKEMQDKRDKAEIGAIGAKA